MWNEVTVKRTIGKTGYYPTFTAWEADLDNAEVYQPDDDAVMEEAKEQEKEE